MIWDFPYTVQEDEKVILLRIKRKDTAGKGFDIVRIISELTVKRAGKEGYLFFNNPKVHPLLDEGIPFWQLSEKRKTGEEILI